MFAFTGFLFAFCFVTGEKLAAEGNILWTVFETFRILAISLAAGGAGGVLCCKFFYGHGRMANRIQRRIRKYFGSRPLPAGAVKMGRWLWGRPGEGGSLQIFCGSFALIFLSWLPAFLAYYPAICAYDIPAQTEQILLERYIDHHPIAHTLLLKGFLQLGERMFGNINAGVACYALFQMLCLAFAFAFGVRLLYKHRAKRIWLLAVQSSCMLYPFHAYMSISVTKDTIFGAFFLLSLIALREMAEGNNRYMPLFVLAGTGVLLFRTNGKYAFCVLLAFLLAAVLFGEPRGASPKNRAFWGKIFAVAAGTFLIGNLALALIFRAVHAEQGDRREMLSIPIQQLARTMVYHGGAGILPEDDGAMSETDRALINDFFLNEAYRSYRPDLADPVKRHTNTYVARYRTKEFLSTYLGLFLQFPGDYLNAALAVNAGYLYPGDVSHAHVNAQEGQADGGGYAQTRWDVQTMSDRGIYKDSKWPKLFERMERWANENNYLKYPLFKYLFVPGVWIWFYMLLVQWLLLRRKFAACVPHALVFGYFFTLLLGPTVQLRYLYPIMIAFPFLLVVETCKTAESGGNVV